MALLAQHRHHTRNLPTKTPLLRGTEAYSPNLTAARATCRDRGGTGEMPVLHLRVGPANLHSLLSQFAGGRRHPLCERRLLAQLTQRSERFSELLTEELRLFPRSKVSAFREPVVVNQFGIGFLGPALRGLIDLVRKGAHRNRDGDVPGGEKSTLIFPVETSRRDRGICQPVERDVIEDVVSRQALGLTIENACDERLTARVVIKDPPRKTNRRVRDSV